MSWNPDVAGEYTFRKRNRRRLEARRRALGHRFGTDLHRKVFPWAVVEQLEDRTLLSALVTTDKQDYSPGSTALITATSDGGPAPAFLPGETVQFHVSRADGVQDLPPANQPWNVTDGVGGFTPYQDASGMWWYPDTDGMKNGSIGTSWYVDQQYAGASL